MESEMLDQQPLMHLLSKYVIRPSAFDRDPFFLPKAASINKYHGYNAYKQPPKPVVPAAPVIDDFEIVEGPKVRKAKPPKPVTEEVTAPKIAEAPKVEATKVEAPKVAEATKVEATKVEAPK